jgi:enoyl-CoA hydratase/carnithine racemase
MPMGCALELVMWGDTQYDARRCYEIGWVQKVVPRAQLMEAAMAYARRMVDLAPRAVRNNKQMIYRGFNLNPIDAMKWGSALEQNLQGMHDSVEGPLAFSEKRRPNFTDS